MRRPPDLPIRIRIALTIFAVASSLLVLMSIAVYVAFDHQLIASLDGTLRLRAESNLQFVNLTAAQPALLVSGDPGLSRSDGESLLRLYDAHGVLLTDASPATGSGAGELNAVQRVITTRRNLFLTVDLGSDEAYRVLVSPLTANGALAGVLVTGIERSRVNRPIEILRLMLLVAVPLTSLLLGLGGYWIARRALRPVASMTSVADQIASGDLTRRIAPGRSHDELGQLAHTLNSMFERLNETVERERRFTSDASHELRTPLTSIETSIDVTLSQERPVAEYQRVLHLIRRQTRRLHALTRQLLLLSRLDAHEVQREFVEIELNGFLEAVAESFREAHSGIAVQLAPTDQQLDVRGDIELLARAFTNVLENAAVHAGTSALIVIETRRLGSAQALMRISDDGPGVPPDLAEEIFQRFRRGDESRHTAGNGLGLAIVDAIMTAHGGSIRLDASASSGACFEFRLPLA